MDVFKTLAGGPAPPAATTLPVPAPVIFVLAAGITTSGMMLKHAPWAG